jgi:hypothetical protein
MLYACLLVHVFRQDRSGVLCPLSHCTPMVVRLQHAAFSCFGRISEGFCHMFNRGSRHEHANLTSNLSPGAASFSPSVYPSSPVQPRHPTSSRCLRPPPLPHAARFAKEARFQRRGFSGLELRAAAEGGEAAASVAAGASAGAASVDAGASPESSKSEQDSLAGEISGTLEQLAGGGAARQFSTELAQNGPKGL